MGDISITLHSLSVTPPLDTLSALHSFNGEELELDFGIYYEELEDLRVICGM